MDTGNYVNTTQVDDISDQNSPDDAGDFGLQPYKSMEIGQFSGMVDDRILDIAVDQFRSKLSTKQSRSTFDYALSTVLSTLGRQWDTRSLVDWRDGLHEAVLSGSLSLSSMNKYMWVVTGVTHRLYLLDVLSEKNHARVCDILETVKHTEALAGRYVYAEEREQVMEYLSQEGTPQSVRNILVLQLLYHGLRRNELLGLKLSDVNETTVIVRGKGNKSRVVPLHLSTQYALKMWLTVRGDDGDYLITPITKSGSIQVEKSVSSQALNKTISKICSDAGVAVFTPHDLRRSFISDLLEAGVDVIAVSKVVGHASVEQTAKYDRRPERLMAEKIQLLDIGKWEL
jgi:integrase